MARVLLAEDEALVRELAIEDLSDAGYEVVAARDGDEALAILQQDTRFDLLFTDIRMPGELDGWQLAEEAKRLIPGIVVIYASGLDETHADARAAGHFVSKPYTLNSLLALLAELKL